MHFKWKKNKKPSNRCSNVDSSVCLYYVEEKQTNKQNLMFKVLQWFLALSRLSFISSVLWGTVGGKWQTTYVTTEGSFNGQNLKCLSSLIMKYKDTITIYVGHDHWSFIAFVFGTFIWSVIINHITFVFLLTSWQISRQTASCCFRSTSPLQPGACTSLSASLSAIVFFHILTMFPPSLIVFPFRCLQAFTLTCRFRSSP